MTRVGYTVHRKGATPRTNIPRAKDFPFHSLIASVFHFPVSVSTGTVVVRVPFPFFAGTLLVSNPPSDNTLRWL